MERIRYRALKSPEAIRRMFDAVAHRYDLLNRVLSFGLDKCWRVRTARLAMAGSNLRILDVCTGTGDLAIVCSELDEQSTVIGLDSSRVMLSVARRKVDWHGLSHRVQFVQGDALRMPFRDGSFDAATMAFGARSLADLETGIRDMTRVVRPGGTIAVLELTAPRSFIGRFLLRHLVPCIGRVASGASDNAYKYLSESVLTFLEPSALAQMMVHCDLIAVTVHRILPAGPVLYKARYPGPKSAG